MLLVLSGALILTGTRPAGAAAYQRTITTPKLESLMLQVDLWFNSSLFRSIAPLSCYAPLPPDPFAQCIGVVLLH